MTGSTYPVSSSFSFLSKSPADCVLFCLCPLDYMVGLGSYIPWLVVANIWHPKEPDEKVVLEQ